MCIWFFHDFGMVFDAFGGNQKAVGNEMLPTALG